MGEWVDGESNGSRAYLAVPDSGNGPGVLVLHAWWGLTTDFTDICDRLAANGFVALAPSLYANGATADSIAEAEALVSAHDRDPDEAKTIALAAVDRLLGLSSVSRARIGVIGFSMGAYWALHLSQIRPDDIAAVVTVYGIDDGDYSTARAAYLGHFAENDDYEPAAAARALEATIRAAGREVTFHFYPGTGHWFVEPSRPDAYDPAAAELVWQRTVAFFAEHLT
jgi:carboxymethylenebutenolidase